VGGGGEKRKKQAFLFNYREGRGSPVLFRRKKKTLEEDGPFPSFAEKRELDIVEIRRKRGGSSRKKRASLLCLLARKRRGKKKEIEER